MDFTTHKDRYEEQLKSKEEQQNMDSEQILDYITNLQNYSTEVGGEMYRVHFDSREEFLEGHQILHSDEALVDYYEKHDKEALRGLKSKWKINIVGKKNEKKKLRKKYIKTHSEADVEREALVQRKNEIIEKQKKEGVVYEVTGEEIKEEMKNEEVQSIVSYFRLLNTPEDELVAITKQVSGLSHMKRQQLLKMINRKHLDADLIGLDCEEVKEKQEKYAKTKCSRATWETFRLERAAREYDEDHELPDDAEELREQATFHTGSEFYERTAKAYMKEVKYTIKNGKKVPASRKYEENLAFNKQFIHSLLSDNEDDWAFRFKELEKNIDEIWNEYSKLLKDFFDGKFDFNKLDIDWMKLYSYGKKNLCMSGMANERTGFFRSKYCKSLPKERQQELEEKNEIMTSFLNLISLKVGDMGLSPSGFKYQRDGVSQVTSDRMFEPISQSTEMYREMAAKYL